MSPEVAAEWLSLAFGVALGVGFLGCLTIFFGFGLLKFALFVINEARGK